MFRYSAGMEKEVSRRDPTAEVRSQASSYLPMGSVLVADFTPEEWAVFGPRLTERIIAEGKCILEEHAPNRELIFLTSGRADVIKKDKETGMSFVVRTIEAGEALGEMSFITGEPATATVRATTECRIMAIDQASAMETGCYSKLVANTVRQNSERLNQANAVYARALAEQVKNLERSKEFGLIFIVMVIIAGFKDFIQYDVEGVAPLKVICSSWGSLLTMLVPVLFLVLRMKTPLSTYGVSQENLRKSIIESLVFSAVLTPIIILIKALTKPDEALFTFHFFSGWPLSMTILYFVLYPFHSYIQEFIARGVMQGALERFMFDAHLLKPIFIAALMFGILHMHKSIEAGVITFAMSFGFGLIYYRHKNLIGVSIVHYLLGFLAQALGYL